MKSRKLLVKALVFTMVCLSTSYVSANFGRKGSNEKYPLSVLSAVADQTGTAMVKVNLIQKTPNFKFKHVVLKTISFDVEVQFSGTDLATFALDGSLPPGNQKPEAAWTFKENGDDSVLEVNESSHDFVKGFNINLHSNEGKLKVILPLSVTSLKIETVSGHSKVIGKTLAQLEIKSVSGDCEGTFEQLTEFERKTVSGETKIIADFGHILGKSVSGDFSIESKNDSPKIEISTTSGEMKLVFDKKPDVSLQFSSVSGEFHIDPKFGTLTSGKGSLQIKSVSGDITVGPK